MRQDGLQGQIGYLLTAIDLDWYSQICGIAHHESELKISERMHVCVGTKDDAKKSPFMDCECEVNTRQKFFPGLFSRGQ